MNFAQTASLCILIAGTGAIWAVSEARAQGAPAFQSDVERQDREREAQRAERRKSYGPVVYPKFMDGGAKPDIAPEKPPVVYLENNEQPGTIIVHTNERYLYVVQPGGRRCATASASAATASPGKVWSRSRRKRNGRTGHRPRK